MLPTTSTSRGIRFLVFLGYAAACALILGGFFLFNWSPIETADLRGYEMAGDLLDAFEDELIRTTGDGLVAGILPDPSALASDVAVDVMQKYWPAVAVFYIAFLGVGYGFQALWAFIFVLTGRPIFSYTCFGRVLAVLGMVATFISAIAVPVLILVGFQRNFFPDGEMGDGYWLALIGLVLGALTPILFDFLRLFIAPPSRVVPVDYAPPPPTAPGGPWPGFGPPPPPPPP